MPQHEPEPRACPSDSDIRVTVAPAAQAQAQPEAHSTRHSRAAGGPFPSPSQGLPCIIEHLWITHPTDIGWICIDQNLVSARSALSLVTELRNMNQSSHISGPGNETVDFLPPFVLRDNSARAQ